MFRLTLNPHRKSLMKKVDCLVNKYKKLNFKLYTAQYDIFKQICSCVCTHIVFCTPIVVHISVGKTRVKLCLKLFANALFHPIVYPICWCGFRGAQIFSNSETIIMIDIIMVVVVTYIAKILNKTTQPPYFYITQPLHLYTKFLNFVPNFILFYTQPLLLIFTRNMSVLTDSLTILRAQAEYLPATNGI